MRQRLLGFLTVLTSISTVLIAFPGPSYAESDSDDFCYTTRSTHDSPAYTDTDPNQVASASAIYDWVDWSTNQSSQRFSKDVEIPAGLISADYVPQGLAVISNWRSGYTEDLMLISAYRDADHDTHADPGAKARIYGVTENGSREGTAMGYLSIAPGHAGGIAVVGNYVYVGGINEIVRFKKSTVVTAINGASSDTAVSPYGTTTVSYTVGFMGSGGGYLWAGQFDKVNPTHANPYSANATTGALSYKSAYQSYAPKKTQGVYATSSHIIFATSHDRDDRGNLWIMSRNQTTLTDGNSMCFRAPSMIEGLTVLDGRLYANYESGANTYALDDNKPLHIIKNLHGAPLSQVEGLYSLRNSD